MIRFFDIIFSVLGLVVLAPVFAAICLKIKLGSKGGCFYIQERIGKDGKPFGLYKFRTMRIGADNEGLLTVGEHDQRITHIGYFLRKTKMDELPQLLNVLIGDMSIVGPRPLVQGELEAHNGLKLYQKVSPGITGWWGCNGRSDIDYKERLELEYYYVKNVSFSLDFICILRTAKAILQHKGAK